MRTRIKICGITRWEDAAAAVELGVDALGFVFHRPSPRYVIPENAMRIIERLPAWVTPVGVFVDMAPTAVRDTFERCGLRLAQLHGQESPLLCAAMGVPWIKAFRVAKPGDLDSIRNWNLRNGFLLDSFVAGAPGGTGRTFDWSLACRACSAGPLILAGGLNPENVGAAIRTVRPFGVDVSSGVESAPGVKDHARLVAFVAAVREADNIE